MDDTNNQPTPDQMQPPAGTPPTGTPPAQAPSGVGSAITGQPPTTAQPTPNAAQPIPTTVAGQPNQPNAAQPAPDPLDSHISTYRNLLKKMTPSASVGYVDAAGNPQQQKLSLGRVVLASVLSGMMAPNVYRQGAYGPILDRQAGAANAFNAGQGVVTKAQQDAQAQSDLEVKNKADSQSRMLGVAKSNVEMMHLYAATMADMGKSAQQQVDNFAPTLQIAKDHDNNLQSGDTKAVLGSGYTMDEALKHPEFKGAMLKHSIIPDGIVYIDDDQGHQIPTQTWTIIDPNVKVSLDAPSVAIVSQINPQWKDAFDATNGNMQIQLGKIQQVTQQVNSVQHAERLFTDAANSDDKLIQGLGLKGDINGEIMSAVRQGTPGARQALQALMAMENAGASQGTLADALNRLITDKDHAAGARYVLDALGTTPEKAEKYVREDQRERARQDAADKEAGKLALQKAKPITFQTAAGIANDPNESPDRVATANAVILAHQTSAASTAAAVAKAQEPFKLRQQMQEQALRTGTPEEAGKLMANGDLTLTELKSRGSTPDFIVKATQAANAINPKYNAQKADAEYKIASNQANTTFFGSANSLLDKDGTLDQLAANYAKLENGQIPLFNKWADYAGYEAGDPAMAGFMQTAVGVADDYAKVMGGGTGSDTSRLQVMKSFANAHNPQQMASAIQAARDAVNSQTKSRMGSNGMLKKMYSSDSATNPNTPKTQFQAVSSDGKWGYDGKNWVSTTGAK